MRNAKVLVDSCVFIDAFDPQSPNHAESLDFLNRFRAQDLIITMPAHAWFEVQCSFQKLAEEKRFSGPLIQGQLTYPVQLIHIDEKFIVKYQMADIPYIKAGDHIFLAVAKTDDYLLVTSDDKMTSVARRCGVRVVQPRDATGSPSDGP